MINKRSIALTLILALFAGLVSVISADDHQTGNKPLISQEALQAATGLDAAGLRAEMADGKTVAELIEANDGDVDAFIAEMAAAAKARLEAQMAQRETTLSDEISDWLQGKGRRGKHRMLFAAAEKLQEATGLDADGLRDALRDGATLAELIEANDGDVDAFIAEMASAAKAELEAQLAEQESALSEQIAAWIHGEAGKRRGRFIIVGTAVRDALQEATGLDAAGLRQALENGESIEALIEANGGDVDETLSSIAESAIESMSRARMRFAEMRAHMDEVFEDAWRRFRGPRRLWNWMPRLASG